MDNPENQSGNFSNFPNPAPQTTPPEKSWGYFGKWVLIIIFVVGAYLGGYQAGRKGFVFVPKSFQVINQNNAPATVDYNLLWDAINAVNQKYIDKPVDQQKVLYGAVQGAVAAVGDPYTTFFPPQQLQDFQTSLKGSFEGIGAEVGIQDGNIVVVAPLDGTPAQKAGLETKDIIAAVDGQSTANWSVDEAVSKIRGPKGTQVTLSIVRSGQSKPFDVKITRDTITVKSVKWSYKTIQQINGQWVTATSTPTSNVTKKIAVITISEFGDDTKGLFDQAVNEILTKNVDGLIIDLRNNPGGYLQTAVDVASNWVKQGDLVVSEAHSDGTTDKYTGEGNPRLAGLKTVVLINGGTASAAEILSGALHDHGFATLVGEKSFGKGSVQELVNLTGGSAVKITIAKWITPNGVNLNHNGLDPDIKVVLSQDDITAGRDPQMDSALQQFTK